jgi:hypothetical protein
MSATYQILQIQTGGAEINDIYPQVAHMGEDYRWHDPDSVTNIEVNQPLAIAPNLHSFHLDEATNLTDLVSQSYTYTQGLLLSATFYHVLAGYCLQDHETYAAEVVLHGRSYPYRYVHMIEDVEVRIDYLRSEFSIRRPDGGIEDIEIPSQSALIQKRVELSDSPRYVLRANKIVFCPETPHYDLFCLTLTGHVFCVSERLARNLRDARLTGFCLHAGPVVDYAT